MSTSKLPIFSGVLPAADQRSEKFGQSAYALIEKLYPLCRSITGRGARETLAIVNEEINLDIHEIPSGTEVFDWVVPEEWNIRSAWIEDLQGNKIIDFNNSNLHVVSYSLPVDEIVSREELDKHLHSLPEHPDWIPYRTSYYHKTWGFCVTEKQREALQDDQYRVFIDAEFSQGSLSYGEYFLKGKSEQEFLIFTHICHPSLCNDNLSGISIATQLARELTNKSLNKSYRFIFAPATIGSITWLSQNRDKLDNIQAGLVIAVAGDSGPITYKKNRNSGSYIDKIALNVLNSRDEDFNTLDFSPYGYDERQFCSPGINLPVGSLMRTPNGCYPEYHTSADNLNLVKPECLADTVSVAFDILTVFDNDASFVNLEPYGEPQLGKRGLYRKSGGLQSIESSILAKLWVLNLSDREHSLLDIAARAKLDFKVILGAAKELYDAGLLEYYQSSGIES